MDAVDRRAIGSHRCIAPDLPGYGRRDRSCALPKGFGYSRDEQVAFVDELLEVLDVRSAVTLVVHDVGGIMGVPWAAARTERLRGVVYTNTVAFPRFPWFPLARRWGDERAAGRIGARVLMAALGAGGGRYFREKFGAQNPQLPGTEVERLVRDFALNDIAKATTLRHFRQITRPEFFDRYGDLLERIAARVPTATLWGDADPYVPTRYAQELVAGRTTVLPAVGHWVPLVAPGQLASEIVHVEREACG